ncbi:hypothetical protein [Allocoleopsis sp.]|uniref:hypothetical protein n=1 Tax=Allocoleopsis sp. TaxID=3088169 RepID=UPI002FD07AAC
MPVAQKPPKSASTNGKPKKDLSGLYQKPKPKSLPIQSPQLGLDIELDFVEPDDEVKAALDSYIIHVTRATLAPTKLTDEELLELGKAKFVSLSAYIKKVALQQRTASVLEEVGGVKNSELLVLRDRMATLITDLEYAIDQDYEEQEALSFHMHSDEKAVAVLCDAIARCFPELENPQQLTGQTKYILALVLLGMAGKIIAV